MSRNKKVHTCNSSLWSIAVTHPVTIPKFCLHYRFQLTSLCNYYTRMAEHAKKIKIKKPLCPEIEDLIIFPDFKLRRETRITTHWLQGITCPSCGDSVSATVFETRHWFRWPDDALVSSASSSSPDGSLRMATAITRGAWSLAGTWHPQARIKA